MTGFIGQLDQCSMLQDKVRQKDIAFSWQGARKLSNNRN